MTATRPQRRSSAVTHNPVTRVKCSIVNAYLAGDDECVLIDAGMPLSASKIREAAALHYARPPVAIVLTHGHFDHVGSLRKLADEWDVPIYAHPLELPYLTGRSQYPPPDPAVGGGGMALMSRFLSRGPIDVGDRVRPLPGDGSVPHLPGWRWIATPGHSPGHVSFFRDADRTLIAGDAFVAQKQESVIGAVTGWPAAVEPPPAYFTIDWLSARQSVQTLAALDPAVAHTGHGPPLSGDTLRQGLAELLEHWKLRIPRHGRYVRTPAFTDAHGVRSVPPPVPDRQLLTLLAAVGAVGVIACLATRRSHSSNP